MHAFSAADFSVKFRKLKHAYHRTGVLKYF